MVFNVFLHEDISVYAVGEYGPLSCLKGLTRTVLVCLITDAIIGSSSSFSVFPFYSLLQAPNQGPYNDYKYPAERWHRQTNMVNVTEKVDIAVV